MTRRVPSRPARLALLAGLALPLAAPAADAQWYDRPYGYNVPPPAWGREEAPGWGERVLPPRLVLARLADRGFDAFTRPRFDGRVYVLDATGPNGARVRLVVDAFRGAILDRAALRAPAERDEDDWDEPPRRRGPDRSAGWWRDEERIDRFPGLRDREGDPGPRRSAPRPDDPGPAGERRRPGGAADPDGSEPDEAAPPRRREAARPDPARNPEDGERRLPADPRLAPGAERPFEGQAGRRSGSEGTREAARPEAAKPLDGEARPFGVNPEPGRRRAPATAARPERPAAEPKPAPAARPSPAEPPKAAEARREAPAPAPEPARPRGPVRVIEGVTPVPAPSETPPPATGG